MEGKSKSINNRLWRARKQAGLEQKQVAYLLGHKTTDQISRYERGARMPSFQTALKLELIYRTPLHCLFPEHYAGFREDISERLKRFNISNLQMEVLPEENNHLCTALAALDKSKLTENETDCARKHAVALHKKLSEGINRTKSTND